MDVMSYDEICASSNWREGAAHTVLGQRFVCVGFEPHTRRDGIQTALVRLTSECAECGAGFMQRYPALITPANLKVTRRCPKHARQGRLSKRAKRKATIARKSASVFD